VPDRGCGEGVAEGNRGGVVYLGAAETQVSGHDRLAQVLAASRGALLQSDPTSASLGGAREPAHRTGDGVRPKPPTGGVALGQARMDVRAAAEELARMLPHLSNDSLDELGRQVGGNVTAAPYSARLIAEERLRRQQAAGVAPSLESPTAFQTARGSTYVVHDDGTTTRTKAARSDPGHEGDFGPKARSAATYFVTPQDASRLGPPSSAASRIVDHGDGTISLVTQNADGRWGVAPSQRNVPYERAPRVGLTPLEVWRQQPLHGLPSYGRMHFGNAITSVGAAPSTLVSARGAPLLSAERDTPAWAGHRAGRCRQVALRWGRPWSRRSGRYRAVRANDQNVRSLMQMLGQGDPAQARAPGQAGQREHQVRAGWTGRSAGPAHVG
jgi:hypothetical protein